MATEVGKKYMAGFKGIGNMLENGNTRERQQALDIVEKRIGSQTAEDILSGKLQAKDRIICDTVPIIVSTSPQFVEFFDSGKTAIVKGFRSVAGGLIEKDCILENMMIEYGTKVDTNLADAFTKAAMPPSILTGELELTHDSLNVITTPTHHFAFPDENNNNLLNGLRLSINHPKIFNAQKKINAKLFLLNGVPAVANTTQMLRLSCFVTEFSANIAQAQ